MFYLCSWTLRVSGRGARVTFCSVLHVIMSTNLVGLEVQVSSPVRRLRGVQDVRVE